MAHESVLLHDSCQALQVQSDGLYIDGTFGRGGHSHQLIKHLGPNGKLLAIDKDPTAICHGKKKYADDPRVDFHQQSFADLRYLCEEQGYLGCVDGVLLDLGVSSPQLDEAHRGFSFMKEGPLDMRMDPSSGQSVAQWLKTVDEKELASVLFEYGQERFAKRIAKLVVETRQTKPIETTLDLADLIRQAMPFQDRHKHPATRSFQALRIFINRELEDLDQILQDSLTILKPGGRMAVISFHSLEDRRVKQFVQSLAHPQKHYPPGFPQPDCEDQIPVRWVIKKHFPSQDEIKANPRARSAVLRVFERC